MRKEKELIENLKTVWEGQHSGEIGVAYNKIVEILAELDIYSSNMLVNLLWLQIAEKTYKGTVEKREVKK
jgi:hypothetical protein